ncbi:cohesin domain-containing protein [Sporosarcina sp. FSL K6-3457]|uniref:cohesin domain-containing protein n=1 Tax=Sporosarcina sp. FSL K6-3457 TaxID=2978204 RepID=UPI0030F5BEC3
MLSLFILLLPATLAHAISKPVVGVSTVYVEKTGTVNLSVFIDSDERIASGSFEMVYDPTLLTMRTVKEGTAWSNQLKSLNSAEPGKVAVAWAQTTGVSMKGTVIDFSVSVPSASIGSTINLTLKNVKLFDAQGREIAAQVLDGQVKPFTGEVKEHPGTVDVNKEWTIRLSTPYNPATLNNQTVTVKRGTVAVEVIITQIDATTFKVSPKNPYTKVKHTLEITDQLRSISGGKLNKPVRHEFTVK